MTLLESLAQRPGVVAVLLIVFAFLLAGATVKIVKIRARSANIRAHGWPPAHVDADGNSTRSVFRDDD
jgi:hypothetical protein